MKRLLTVLIAAALALTAYPAFASIQGSPHDISGTVYGLCEACHVPHAATGKKRLWNQAPAAVSTFVNWSTPKKIGALCGTCHLTGGTLHTIANKAGLNVSQHLMDSLAYSDTSHNNKLATLGLLETNAQNAALPGKPYTAAGATMECTSCHNPHQDGPTTVGNPLSTGIRPFLRAGATTETISDFCAECHATRESSGVGALTSTDNTTDGSTVGTGVVGDPALLTTNWNHNHPVNIPYGNNNATEVGWYKALGANATPLTIAEPHGTANGALMGWSLGGKFLKNAAGDPLIAGTDSLAVNGSTAANTPASQYLGCQTCHAVHSPGNDGTTLTTPANGTLSAKATWLLAVANTGSAGVGYSDGRADLCETCHGQPIAASRWQTRVGALAGGDHPIDGAISTDAITTFITGWTGGVTPFTPPVGRKTVDRSNEVWPTGVVAPSAPYSAYQIICTSCHSAHRAGARLRRQGGSTDFWCKSCHPSVAPLGHHSNKYNLASSTIDCTDCHVGTLGSGMAHNGFTFYVVAGDNTGTVGAGQVPWGQAVTGPATALANPGTGGGTGCTSCHFLGTSLIEPGSNTAPVNRLGTAMASGPLGTGAQTHYMGTIATNGGLVGINVKTTNWNGGGVLPDHLGHRRDFSKYGTILPGDAAYSEPLAVGTANFVTPASITASSVVFVGCESCHSVLGNIGRATSGPTMANTSSGWENNLLLQDYRDDSYSTGSNTAQGGAGLNEANARGVGSEFCVGCHNQGTADALAAGTGSGTAGPVSAAVISGNGKGGVGPNDIAPPNMHPMTGWSITKAVDVGRGLVGGLTDALMTTDYATDPATYGSYANAGTTRPTATGIGGAANGTDGTAAVAGQGAVSYPNTNAMDCDSCHRPHNASKNSYSDSGHITVRGKVSGVNIPTILEYADTSNDNGGFCTRCHSY